MKSSYRLIAVAVLLMSAVAVFAQSYGRYEVRLDKVFYAGAVINGADAYTIRDLGYGYAKDKNNVYWNGQVLPFVDPVGFKLHGGHADYQPVPQEPAPAPRQDIGQALGSVLGSILGQVAGTGAAPQAPEPVYIREGYFVDCDVVLYNGVLVEGANPGYFQDLGNGYAIDDRSSYYAGQKIKGITSVNFRSVRDGYARNTNNIYYLGKKIDVTSPSSFTVLKDGYAKDSFRVYYCGVLVKNATASSFKVLGDGYAKDSFRTFHRGVQTR